MDDEHNTRVILFAAAVLALLPVSPAARAEQRGQPEAVFPAIAAQERSNRSSLHYNPNPVRAGDFLEQENAGPEAVAPAPSRLPPVEPPEPVATPSVSPGRLEPPSPSPAKGTGARDAALARRDAAFRAYTRLVTEDIAGDVEAALAEYKAAVNELERLDAKPRKKRRR